MENSQDQTAQWEDLVIPKADKAPAPKIHKPQPGEIPPSYLAHELRAPLTSIRLGLEILQEQLEARLEPDEKQMLSLAVRNAFRLDHLVDDIMDFSKIMAGRMSLQKEPSDARDLVQEAVDCLQATAISASVKLVREEGEPLPRISAEGRRIVQILTNLISNAIKFTPARGTVTVSVRKAQYEHEGTLVFKVKDNGKGIPAQDIERVFDMFIQSAGNIKKTAGTGLGLTLCRLMVELHGGRIWAESWRGVGASFYFTIPIAAEDMGKRIEPYPRPVEYTGLLVTLARRINAFLALFV